jgi:hypothetical protein
MIAKVQIPRGHGNRMGLHQTRLATTLANGRSTAMHAMRCLDGPTIATATTTTVLVERKDLAVSTDPRPNGD